MGMHVGMIAAKLPVRRLRDEFLRLHPEYELLASEENLADGDAAQAWLDAHEESVSAADWSPSNPAKSAFVFWEDGPWAVMNDPHYTHAGDRQRLFALSASVGTVISLIVETAGGCAMFWCFQDGRLRRSIENQDGEAKLTGEALAEEVGIDVKHFYMDEAEAIWNAFGLKTFTNAQTEQGWQGICVLDRTDYSDVLAKTKPNKNE
jgi:hypothetical protein